MNKCVTLCDTWHYDTRMTFAPLMIKERNVTVGNSLLGDMKIPYIMGDAIRNYITIDVEPEYQIAEDVLKIDFLTFENNIGDSLGLFLGLSLIAFIQAIYWIGAAYLLIRRRRRMQPTPPGQADQHELVN